jgi:glycosyltransferase involved in cell wall biosynthesis
MSIVEPTSEVILDSVRDASVADDLVTVAVSLFNYAGFLPDCLDSVLKQRHAALELVVVDDVSRADDSVEVARNWLQEHASRFARVLLLQHTRNQGLANVRNTAFRHARAKNVFVMDADNTIYPRAIGRLYGALRTSGAAAAYTQLELFGDRNAVGLADIWNPEWLRHGNYIDAMALISKRAWRDVGGYAHIEGGWEDYDFWCKFIEQGFVAAFVPEMLCRYRVHRSSMLRTETSRNYDAVFVEMTMRHPWMSLAPIDPSDRA